MKGNLLIAQAGGPSTVLNATLKGVIEEAKKHIEIEGIFGAIGGADGILNENIVDLGAQSEEFMKLLEYTPGSVIGTSRRDLKSNDYDKMINILKKYDVKYLFYNGGNGSMETCYKLYQTSDDGIRIIGVPKTIDNDIAITDHTPGYGSAARYMAVTTAEIGEDVRTMPIHVCIIEAMGRHAGWIAASSALARKKQGDAPHLIYLPERPFNLDEFLIDVERLYKKLGGVVAVVSEGIVDENRKPIVPPVTIPGGREPYVGDVGVYLAQQVFQKLGIKCRSEKPGIAGRASATLQSHVDREEAKATGAFAVKAALEGNSGYMVGFERVSNNPYTVVNKLISLDKVSLVEKKMPDFYISKDGKDVTSDFLQYVRPLAGDLPRYAELKYIKPELNHYKEVSEHEGDIRKPEAV